MTQIGVRELKARASEIIRDVRDRRVRVLITHRGRPVGLLVPLDEARAAAPVGDEGAATAWDDLTRLGEEIGRGWRSPLTGAELLSDMRR